MRQNHGPADVAASSTTVDIHSEENALARYATSSDGVTVRLHLITYRVTSATIYTVISSSACTTAVTVRPALGLDVLPWER